MIILSAGQILRSGTAIGSNVEAALAGVSRADLIKNDELQIR
jgi:hypothetical protein